MDTLNVPVSNLGEDVRHDTKVSNAFYVVSLRKFFVLYIATFGLYRVYWFFKNWTQYKTQADSDDVWPIPRAIFVIFFTHSLFAAVDRRLILDGKHREWDSKPLATAFVVLAIIRQILDRMVSRGVGSPVTEIIFLLFVPLMAVILSHAQTAINEACNDPDGDSNDRFSVSNFAWIAVGIVVWLLVLAGMWL